MRTRQGQLRLPDLLRELLHVLVLAAALQRGDAGAAELQNVVAFEHGQKGVDLIRLAGQFKIMLSGDRSMIFAL